MKSWRQIAKPHQDVLQGTFQQSEFAADLSAVRTGKASPRYSDAVQFFDRTFITEGMRLLLTQVARRLSGQGGEPVIQLQTAFGGGKTHTLLAVLHLASRQVPIKDLAGVPGLLESAGLMDVPHAKVAVLDGNVYSPGQSWKHGKTQVNTLWGELALQLGGEEGFALVKESDVAGTSPGKQVLQQLLSDYAPCVVLVDELVAYVRQFERGAKLTGGTYDSNLSFMQALTEAIKLVPNAVMLASLPESEVEAGSGHGKQALGALEKIFGRVQAIWKPVATEEAFEIVRRRLFEPITDTVGRDEVCRAFSALYAAEGVGVPSVTHESRYLDRLKVAYPIHPEVFDRLYEDWTPLAGFQRTRGVLKLMAQVIHRLWSDGNEEKLIMPGSLPLADPNVRSELTTHLTAGGWDPVLDRDIDGPRSESRALDNLDTRFGSIRAALRVSRTLFLATAPASTGNATTKGIDLPRIILGSLQPGENSSDYSDALYRLADQMHHLNASGEKKAPGTKFWFDTRATLRREMEDRRNQLEGSPLVVELMKSVLEKVTRGMKVVDGVHVFTAHADVPDDGSLRLVVLGPDYAYTKDEPRLAFDAVHDYLKKNGGKPRYRANRLLFVAPEQSTLDRLRVNLRTALAWESVVDAIKDEQLVVDGPQARQAAKELETAQGGLGRIARECFKWLLVPGQDTPTDRSVKIEVFPLNPGTASLGAELESVMRGNELTISKWAPVHLRSKLRELYWKSDKPHANALSVWDDMTKYLYLPRLRDRRVFEAAIDEGLKDTEFFAAARGEKAGTYEGLRHGDGPTQIDDTLLLIDPEIAAIQKATQVATVPQKKTGRTPHSGSSAVSGKPVLSPAGNQVAVEPARSSRYFAQLEIKPTGAKMALLELYENLFKHFAEDPDAELKISVEFSAEFPKGASPQLKRVSENAGQISGVKVNSGGWE